MDICYYYLIRLIGSVTVLDLCNVCSDILNVLMPLPSSSLADLDLVQLMTALWALRDIFASKAMVARSEKTNNQVDIAPENLQNIYMYCSFKHNVQSWLMPNEHILSAG